MQELIDALRLNILLKSNKLLVEKNIKTLILIALNELQLLDGSLSLFQMLSVQHDNMNSPEGIMHYYLKNMKAQVLARAFVYELVVFRSVIRRIENESDGTISCSRRLDDEIPHIVGVRDTLAHLDERTLGLSRGRRIDAKPTMIGDQELSLGFSLEGNCIGAHMANGEYGRIYVSPANVEICHGVLEDILDALA